MDYIGRLPQILAILAAIVTGLISYRQGIDAAHLYPRMFVSLLLFLVIGFFARSVLYNLYDEYAAKKNEELSALEDSGENNEAGNAADENSGKAAPVAIDYRVDDITDDGFTPLTVGNAIRKQMNSDGQ